ncbi:uncharacterized protein HMPREF1541_11039 [Cyphellophora europaea CBS 101466]|uniref:Copper-fist domain-containing protein n=1 Tax=Cyphellophora europaea (strain CBS 101466) TaxID=1220924 RepID=W2S7A4_CYPE1|nr:uncharacterized protein HMPREF1541_11039 [Cyphellophora europaea CBS 101466]ETN43908.1 hypothetical protein HMPREF1541_11039 [Cyphellophora europaea CBS 101466]
MEEKKGKKAKEKAEQIPKQFFDGKTYACQSCKNGHRVRTCNHGRTKPIAPTNQPGRPSSGSKRKCTCPKNCGCKDNCKCGRDCLCVQKMYLICLVSKPDAKDVPRTNSPKPPVWENERGQSETLKTVWADASGQLLTDNEAQRRQREKEQREQGQSGGCCSTKQPEEEIAKPAPKGGCRHRDAVKQEQATPTLDRTSLAPSTTSRCTCGTACQCTLCPEHPNNAATRQYNAQTLNLMATQHNYLPAPSMMSGSMYTPDVPQESCMGGQPRFFLSRNKPTQQDFQNFFPSAMSGDYVMSYPVDQWGAQSPLQSPPTMPLQQYPDPQPEAQMIPDLPADTLDFDNQFMSMNMDWTSRQQDDMWEMRLGDASVDQISQFPTLGPAPTPNMQLPGINGFQHLSPDPAGFHSYEHGFQHPGATGVSSPDAFSVSMSALSSPPPMPSSYASFAATPDINFSEHNSNVATPVSQPRSQSGSCCGGSRTYSPDDTTMFDVTLPNMPLSPIPSPRMVQTGPAV